MQNAMTTGDKLSAIPTHRGSDPATARERVMREIRALELEENVVELETLGYTTLRKVLPPEVIAQAKAAILRRVKETTGKEIDLETESGDGLTGTTYLPYLLYDDEVFERILMEPKPLALITYLLGESCLLSSLGCHLKGPSGAPLPLHSDNGNGIPAPFSSISQVANVNYALTPYSRANGALAMVPGSHKLARQPTAVETLLAGERCNPNAVAMDLDPGDAVVWHGNTWHGSFAREVPGVRMNLAVYFNRQYIQTQERHRDAVPQAMLDRHANDERFRILLGEKQPYGWQLEGPDYSVMARSPRGLYD